MGVDILGSNPSSHAGRFFMNNWGAWSELVRYMKLVAPEILQRCPIWFSNDGQGLDEADALELADRLEAALETGGALEYARQNEQAIKMKKCGACQAYSRELACTECDSEGYVDTTEP